jgi:hypothetical protein
MVITRYSGMLYSAQGPVIGYRCGLYWWPAHRPHRTRPVYAIHDASDPVGANLSSGSAHAPMRAKR